MGVLRKVGLGIGALVGVVLLAGAGGYLWASETATAKLAAPHDVHRADFPIPFPLTDAEVAALRAKRALTPGNTADPLAGVDLAALANERAVARGTHLATARYGCVECHGANFGGGVMVDDPAIGNVRGPNLTMGDGSRTRSHTAADWDRIVRHGVKPNGTATPMPSKDFFAMSDQELSDMVSYIRSFPAVNNTVAPVTLGPVGKVLVATGSIQRSADIHPTKQQGAHAALPPAAVADGAFGKHLAQTCSGCHGDTYAGGPILGGPPDWPPAKNLTPAGLVGWTFNDFERALKEGRSKNGVAFREPMASMPKFAKNMTDVELRALWEYLRTLPPLATGAR